MLFCGLALASSALAAEAIWTGTTNNPFTSSNWTPNTNFAQGTGSSTVAVFEQSPSAIKGLVVTGGDKVNSAFGVGGIVVKEGATGYTISSGGGYGRYLILNAAAGSSSCLLDINEDFRIFKNSTSFQMVINSDVEMKVAAGKTLTIDVGLVSLNTQTTKEITLSGGGNVTFAPVTSTHTLSTSLVDNWTIKDGTTLTVKNNTANAFGSGKITLQNGILNAYAGSTFSNQIIIAGTTDTSVNTIKNATGYTGSLILQKGILDLNNQDFANGATITVNGNGTITNASGFNQSITVTNGSTLDLASNLGNATSLLVSSGGKVNLQAGVNAVVASMSLSLGMDSMTNPVLSLKTGSSLDCTGLIIIDIDFMGVAGQEYTFNIISSEDGTLSLDGWDKDKFVLTEESLKNWNTISFDVTNGSGYLTLQAIPEPTTATLSLFGLGALLLRRRRTI